MKSRLVACALATGLALAAAPLAPDLDPRAPSEPPEVLQLRKGSRVVLIGNGLGSRMIHFGHFETELHLRYPDLQLFIRNMCDEGNTPSFRPHSGRKHQLGFPGAEKFHHPYSDGNIASGVGHFETEEQWITRLRPDVLLACFGFNESFLGRPGLENFRAELDAFVAHTKTQSYGGDRPVQLVLVSPTAYQDRSAAMDVPDGKKENGNLAAYTSVMEAVAKEHGVLFVNAFSASLAWFEQAAAPLTTDGVKLNDAGYRRFARLLADEVFGEKATAAESHRELVHAAVMDKNWFWINDFKIPNGVHVFGRRYKPFGPDNYPFELEKIREMTAIRDRAIHAAAHGRRLDVAALDAETSTLPAVKTNYRPSRKNGALKFLEGRAALRTIKAPEGYKVEQWATEQEFPDLRNPVQLAFDGKDRLWVAVMPSYPHYRPGDPKPDDKLLILEDTDGDGKADKQTVWADGLHLPMGFELAAEGVYVSQGINLVLLRDTDGDDRADDEEVLLSGFDDHDTHHAISAFCADPSGAIMMCEGVFLRTNVETVYGPVRGTDGGFYRYTPQRRQLERHAQLSIPNPWGVAFDEWGQHFFLHTSGPTVEWMLPGSVRARYGTKTPGSKNLIEPAHRVRPTSGIEFMSSRHFPDEVQGDMLLNNTIGFLGTKQHRVEEDGTGFATKWRQDLVVSSDGNFRPVDLEIAPDGSLYIVDWHNPLIGHMQHNARDPNRDHDHGRIYRVTYPSRPLVEPAKVHGATVPELLANLKLPEYRTRYRTRRELRGRDADAVLAALERWVKDLDRDDPRYEHHLLEGLWVKWGANRVDGTLLLRLLDAEDHRARAAAVRVLRYNGHRIADQVALLERAAADPHGRVKLEAIAAASWLDRAEGLRVLAAAEKSVAGAAPSRPKEAPGLQIAADGGKIEVAGAALPAQEVDEVVLRLPGRNRTLNLAEVEVFSGGKNVARAATWSLSSQYRGGQFPAKNLVDGDRGNFAHTAEGSRNPRAVGAFARPIAIERLVVWNRRGFEKRFDRAQILFKKGGKNVGRLSIRLQAEDSLFDEWTGKPFRAAQATLKNQALEDAEDAVAVPAHLAGEAAKLFLTGAEVYRREGHCATCHQPDGQGLVAAQFPPLAGTRWVNQDPERLIKLTLHGLMGPIEVRGRKYPGFVPMTPFKGLLTDREVAAVLTYVRNAFGNKAPMVTPAMVAEVRAATKGQAGFLAPEKLLKEHPHR